MASDPTLPFVRTLILGLGAAAALACGTLALLPSLPLALILAAAVLVLAGCAAVLAARKMSPLLAALEALPAGQTPDSADLGPQAQALVLAWSRLTDASKEQTALLATLPGLVLKADASGRVVQATGKTPGGLTGSALEDILRAEDGSSPMAAALASDVPVPALLVRDGKSQPVVLAAAALPDGGRLALVLDAAQSHALRKEYDTCRQGFSEVAGQINKLAQKLASATELLSAAADEQAKGAARQKEQTAAVAGTVHDMADAAFEVARNASATAEAADKARAVARDGGDLVGRAVKGIHAVSDSAKLLAGELSGLNRQAEEIGRVIGVISDIADQTNLLALNAAIEAARAGEAGRGFAVVADEVRKLAEKTMTATREVSESILAIQKSSTEAVAAMDKTGAQVQESTDLSSRAGQALQQILGGIEDIVSRINAIASAAQGQSSAAGEVQQLVKDIEDIARDMDEETSQQAYATRELADLSKGLLDVARTVRGGSAPTAKLASSKGHMKGILPKLMQDFIAQSYGDTVAKAVQTELGDPIFLPTDSYPDQVIRQMAESVAKAAGTPPQKVLYSFGLFTPGQFRKLYRQHFKAPDLKSFYLAMNDTHRTLTKSIPGLKPPRFTYEDKGHTLFMNYVSDRALFDYFEGILHGAAQIYGQKVDIKVKPLDNQTARAEIVFK